jgi:hypothetical protein
MLSAAERALLREQAWSCEHDYLLQQLYMGEPFLEDGILYFVDGETLFISAFPLDKPWDAAGIARRVVAQRGIVRVNCWGTAVPDLAFLTASGFECQYASHPKPWNQELVVDFDDETSTARFCKLLRETERRGKARGLQCELRSRGPVEAEHLVLLRTFIGRLSDELAHADDQLDSADVSYYIFATTFLSHSEHTLAVEARWKGRLVGYAQGHLLFAPRLGILCTCVVDPSIAGVSDLLYGRILSEMHDRGCRCCSLGMTINRGLYSFKAKWCGRPTTGGYHQVIWCKPGIPLTGYHWPIQLVETGLRLSTLRRSPRSERLAGTSPQ